eukprot:24840-Amphidinium_carterae.1
MSLRQKASSTLDMARAKSIGDSAPPSAMPWVVVSMHGSWVRVPESSACCSSQSQPATAS